MKSLTIYTLVVAAALALWGTPSMATSGELASVSVSPAEQSDKQRAATSAVPLHALSRLDAQTLAEHEMTDQELKLVEGGQLGLELGDVATGIYGSFLYGFSKSCGCQVSGYVSSMY
jgi:hypothetical protein